MGISEWVSNLWDMPREYHESPIAFRAARYPGGAVRIQGEYIWSEGLRTGSTWKDLPLVSVDKNGAEI